MYSKGVSERGQKGTLCTMLPDATRLPRALSSLMMSLSASFTCLHRSCIEALLCCGLQPEGQVLPARSMSCISKASRDPLLSALHCIQVGLQTCQGSSRGLHLPACKLRHLRGEAAVGVHRAGGLASHLQDACVHTDYSVCMRCWRD